MAALDAGKVVQFERVGFARIEKAIRYLEGNFRRQPTLGKVAGR
jgi:hypothetical protein